MSIDDGKDMGLVVHTPKEEFEANPSLLEIPAGMGSESAKILPKAAYFHADHDQYFREYEGKDSPSFRKINDAYYAVYMFETQRGEVRFISTPVALIGDEQYDQELLGDMTAQGLDPQGIRANCDFRDVKEYFGYLATAQLPDLRKIMKNKSLTDRGFHNRYGAYIDSGWKSTPGMQALSIVGREESVGAFNVNPYYSATTTEVLNSGVQAISQPLNLATRNPFEREIYNKVLKANSPSK